jgi:hypothetical protein
MALATPSGSMVGGTIHAVMAGAHSGPSAGAHGSAGIAGSASGEAHGSAGIAASASGGAHGSVGIAASGSAGGSGPDSPPHSTPPEPTTTAPPTPPTPPAPPASAAGSSSASGDQTPAGCATAHITSVTATVLDGDRAVLVTVMVSGDVGWMSAGADGMGGASLHVVPGGFQGTLTAAGPVVAGTVVHVGTCRGALQASAIVSGGLPGAARSGPSPSQETSPTTTEPHRSVAPGCASATITLLTAVAVDGGTGVRVIALVTGDVGSMSAVIDGSAIGSLQPIPGGFEGTLAVTGSTIVAPGTAVLVGTCGGALQGHTTVAAS